MYYAAEQTGSMRMGRHMHITNAGRQVVRALHFDS